MSKNNIRAHNFTFVVYPESAPADWLDRIDQMHVRAFVSPCHSSDKTDKKPHFHVVISYSNQKALSSVKDIFSDIAANGYVAVVDSLPGMIRYLIHADHPDKEQFRGSDGALRIDFIRTFAGADPVQFFDEETRKVVRDIGRYVVTQHVTSFSELVDYAYFAHPDWLDVVVQHEGYFWKLTEDLKMQRNSNANFHNKLMLEEWINSPDFEMEFTHFLNEIAQRYHNKRIEDINKSADEIKPLIDLFD